MTHGITLPLWLVIVLTYLAVLGAFYILRILLELGE